MTKSYQSEIGIVLNVATGIVLTGASVTALKVKKPSGAIVTWAATIDGTDPKQMNYTTTAGDLNESGNYFIQSSVTLGSQVLLGETLQLTFYGPFQ